MKRKTKSIQHILLPIIHISATDFFMYVFCTGAVMAVSQSMLTDIYIGNAFTIEEISPINFGPVMTGGRPGYVRLSKTGERTANCETCSLIENSDYSAGQIYIKGSDLTGLRINVNDTKIYEMNSGDSVKINNFEASYDKVDSTSGTLKIGGRMNFTGSETNGEYSGIYNINIIFP